MAGSYAGVRMSPMAMQDAAMLGFGGNGITFSMLAAQLVCAEIVGRPDPDTGLFEFP